MSPLFRNLIIALGITVVLGILYFTFIREPDAEEVPVASGEKHEVVLKTEKILSDIEEIKAYAINNSIFTDTRFSSLKDYGVKIQDVDTGRENPFEPAE